MIPLLLGLVSSQAQTPAAETAADYFFLTPGVSREYRTTIGKSTTVSVDVVGTMALVGEAEMIPVATKLQGVEAQKFFYQVKDGDVYIVADWDKKKIDPPIPVLKISESGTSWTWAGGDGLTFDFSSKKGKIRNVFGKDLPTIEFKASGSEGEDDLARKVEQTAIYAKGVGMIEMNEITTTKKSKMTRVVKLTKITGGGW